MLDSQSMRSASDAQDRRYVLITAAKDEEANITRTIRSVLHQTLMPLRWVIVDDSSTDRTREIIKEFSAEHPFISLVENKSIHRNFGNKVIAFNAGLRTLRNVEFAFIGNLDADISLDSGYYEQTIREFQKDPSLGISGGAVHTAVGQSFKTFDFSVDSVGGAVQLFRKECFDQIGGYRALEFGGIDAVAEITARMYGWTVRKIPSLIVWEHRRTGTAKCGILTSMYREGERFHRLGYETIFYLCKCAYRLRTRPFVLGSTVSLTGFLHAKLKGDPLCLPPEIVRYLRDEQKKKLEQEVLRRVQKLFRLVTNHRAHKALG